MLLPDPEKKVHRESLELIRSWLPQFHEKKSYGADFFFHHKSVCFIWPHWIKGSTITSGFMVGISHAHLLDNIAPFEMGTRKKVAMYQFFKTDDLWCTKECIQRAWELDNLKAT